MLPPEEIQPPATDRFRRSLAEMVLIGGVLCGAPRVLSICRDPGYVFDCPWYGTLAREAVAFLDAGGVADAGTLGVFLYRRGVMRSPEALSDALLAIDVFAAWTRGELMSLPDVRMRTIP